MDEANLARPIPQKVAETMRERGAAILVFTADKEYFDKDGVPIWKASENVSHELGTASVMYGERIIIFKAKGIELPSTSAASATSSSRRTNLATRASSCSMN